MMMDCSNKLDWAKLAHSVCLALQDLMIMGAPGSSYWTGSVLVYNVSSNVFAAYVDDDSAVLYGSYLGKSLRSSLFCFSGQENTRKPVKTHHSKYKQCEATETEMNKKNCLFLIRYM